MSIIYTVFLLLLNKRLISDWIRDEIYMEERNRED